MRGDAVVTENVQKIDELGKRKDLPNDIGRALAKISNDLEFTNDQARYFGLGINWRKDKKPGRPAHAREAGIEVREIGDAKGEPML